MKLIIKLRSLCSLGLLQISALSPPVILYTDILIPNRYQVFHKLCVPAGPDCRCAFK